MKRKYLFIIFFFTLFLYYIYPCTTIAVSKEKSKSKNVLLAKNRDLSPNSGQVILHEFRKKHKKGERVKLQFIEIPQVPLTYGFYGFKSLDNTHKDEKEWRWGCGMGVNEYGVVVVDNDANSWWKFKGDKKHVLHDNDVVRLILERCKTAREGVMLIDKLLKNYYIEIPEMYTIADKNEIWIVETCYKYWVANRVKGYMVRANRFEISCPDLPDNSGKYNLKLRDVITFVKKMGHYREEKGKFSFRKSFCDYLSKSNIHYNDVRYKYATEKLEEVKGKIGISDIKNILRSHFENFVYTNPLNGKKILLFNPLVSPHCQRPGKIIKSSPTRTICYSKTVGSMIAEINGNNVKKSVMWVLFSKPCLNVYFPIFPLLNLNLPKELITSSDSYSKNSFWWQCEKMVRLLDNNFKKNRLLRKKVILERKKLEKLFEKRVNLAIKSPDFERLFKEIFFSSFTKVEKFLKKFTKKIRGNKSDLSPICGKKPLESCYR